MAHRDLGYKIVNRLILDIGDAGMVEFMPRMEGTTLHAIIAPARKAEAPPKKPAAEAAAKPAEAVKPAEAAPSAPPTAPAQS
jgi:translation initiation factor IF-3